MSLPRLLYLGDVPVESSYHGSALLYRLLQDYPPEKLLIVERWPNLSKTERRLAGVEYRRLPCGLMRLLPTRFHKAYVPIYLNLTWLDARILWQSVRDFGSEAILSVHYCFFWTSAACLARQRTLPLHLILHDEASACVGRTSLSLGKSMYRHHTETAYKQAASRQCVSPYMVEAYEQRYGVRGTLLYPGRAKDAASFDRPPERLQHPLSQLTVACGGSIRADALREMSLALEPLGGRLLMFGPFPAEEAERWGLNRANIEFRGMISSAEMIQAFRDEADCIFIPMSFAEEYRANMEISFPSKLTDSTISGVPLLIYGPPYCSVVRWARANPGVALVVDSCGPEFLRAALQKIIGSAALRRELGQSAITVGRKFFGFESIRDAFFKGLAGLPA